MSTGIIPVNKYVFIDGLLFPSAKVNSTTGYTRRLKGFYKPGILSRRQLFLSAKVDSTTGSDRRVKGWSNWFIKWAFSTG
jgi:hypothetical protein